MIDKTKGEFVFTMYQNELRKLQYVATYAGERDEAIRGLHYSIQSVKNLSKRARKHQRNKRNKLAKGLSESGALGVNQIPNG